MAAVVNATLRVDVVAVIDEMVGANGTTEVITNDRVTLVAARWFALSAIDATKVHVPAYSIVTVKPLTVHVSVVLLATLTVRPDVVVGATAKVAVSYARSLNDAKVIVWATLATVIVTVFDVASR